MKNLSKLAIDLSWLLNALDPLKRSLLCFCRRFKYSPKSSQLFWEDIQ